MRPKTLHPRAKVLTFLLMGILLCVTFVGTSIPHVSASSSTSKRLVMIRFDDGYQDQFVNAIPVLQKYGFKSSYFGIAAAIDSSNARPGKIDFPYESVSWPEVHTIVSKYNYEIVDHGNYEGDLNHMNQSQLDYEIVSSRQDFVNHGYTNLPDYGLPEGSGFTNQTVLSTIYNAGFFHAWGAGVPYGVSNYSKLEVQFYPQDWIDNDLNMSAFRSQVSHASSSYVVGLEYHLIFTNCSDVNQYNPYSICLPLFKKEMAYLHNNGFTVVKVTNLPDWTHGSSNQGVTISTFPVSMSPSETVQTSIVVHNRESHNITAESLTNFMSTGWPNVTAWMTNSSQLPAVIHPRSSLKIGITVQTSSAAPGLYYLTGQINCDNGLSPTFTITVNVTSS